MLIEPARPTSDGATITVRPDGAEPARITIRLPEGMEADPSIDPAVPATLLPAMRRGETLRCAGDISPRLHESAARFQRILGSWDRHLHGRALRFTAVEIDAPERRAVERGEDGRGTACFFTAGAERGASAWDCVAVRSQRFGNFSPSTLSMTAHAATARTASPTPIVRRAGRTHKAAGLEAPPLDSVAGAGVPVCGGVGVLILATSWSGPRRRRA